MSNKNPFEIRAEMLQMAKDYMYQQYHMNVEFTKQLWEQGKKDTEQMQCALKPYSIKDMMDKAQEMYNFVSKKE